MSTSPRNRLLLALVLILGARPVQGEDLMLDIVDGDLRTACGPICCYVALRSLGCDASLPALARDCGWQEGRMTPFPRLYDALARRSEVTSRPARLSPEELGQALGRRDCVAIIPIRANRSQEVNHAVCVVAADETGVTILDYPELRRLWTFAELAEAWDGEALLVRLSSRGWLRQAWPWLVLPLSVTALLGADNLVRLRDRAQPAGRRSTGTHP